MSKHRVNSLFLCRCLKANGIFSFLSGVALVVGAAPFSRFLGVAFPRILVGVGIMLVLFAIGLFRNARREEIDLKEASMAAALDVGWVAGSAVILISGSLSPAGNWVVALVAEVVLLFAIFQFLGIRRVRQPI